MSTSAVVLAGSVMGSASLVGNASLLATFVKRQEGQRVRGGAGNSSVACMEHDQPPSTGREN